MTAHAINPTIAVRDGQQLNVAIVDSLVKEYVGGVTGKPELSQFKGGNSNLTYLLMYPERGVVLRRLWH